MRHFRPFLPNALLVTCDIENFQAMHTNPYLLELLEIVEQTGANKLSLEYGAMRPPDPEDVLDFEDDDGSMPAFFSWWFKLEDK